MKVEPPKDTKAVSDASHPYSVAGMAEIKRGNFGASLPHFEKALQLNSWSIVALFHYALAFHCLGDFNKAVHNYGQVIKV